MIEDIRRALKEAEELQNKYEIEEKDFLGVYQKAWTHGDSPVMGGYKAGQMAHPVAVIIFGNKLKEVRPEQVIFKED
ncbi:hypothetical protein P3U10_04420 [Mammaliicoccus sciuri]|uniref:hypothetical protein n=1 Tax=Mammaliicoccus sciuri TaxID=1296 RepID=UPI002B25C17E|nr:hypothetical protein [Mammaliicoccus sciuri]WQK61428.1 hypothetical protein P3U10_04420 [Mammaliicoccus sciuri]